MKTDPPPPQITLAPQRRLHPRLLGLEGRWLRIEFGDGTSVTMHLETGDRPLHRGRVGGQLLVVDPDQRIVLVELLASPIGDEPTD